MKINSNFSIFQSVFSMLTLTVFTLLLAVSPAQSGEWSFRDRGDDFISGCNIEFTGRIEKGDLVSLLEQTEWKEGFRHRICLNSPGGSFGEVYRFLTKIDEGRVNEGTLFATKVRTGEECLSACAILFMFGESYGANSPYPDRQIEPGAKLGFHSPFIPGTKSARVDGGDAFNIALQIANILVDRSYKSTTTSGPPFPLELVSLVLGTPGDQMRYVNTLGELKLLNIETTEFLEERLPINIRSKKLPQMLRRICSSTYALTFREHLVQKGYSFEDLVSFVSRARQEGADKIVHLKHFRKTKLKSERLVSVITGPFYNHPGWYSTGAMLYCRVQLDLERKGKQTLVSTYNVDFDLINGTDMSRIPDEGNRSYSEIIGGLLPIDTIYEKK